MGNDNRQLTDAERLDWLRLYRSDNVGPVTFFRLIERFGTATRALEALPDLVRRANSRRPLRLYPRGEAEAELDALERLGGNLIAAVEPSFPSALRALDTAPLITIRGDASLLTQPAIAVVGARNASALGRRVAHSLATDLGENGLVVVSGMARGVDTAAHQGALGSGTVAVLAGGVDVVYPPENQGLYEQICAAGCVISEMPPGMQPQAAHFPRRNRLISGMAMGVVVVEASIRSGSLITAKMALDQGRDVFAVPGSPLDPRCQGPNSLIKQGAYLVETAADVLDGLGYAADQRSGRPWHPATGSLPTVPTDEGTLAIAHRTIVPLLAPAPVTVDEIIRQCQLSPAVVSMVLLELELAGRIERQPGNQVSLLP